MAESPDSYVVLFAILWLTAFFLAVTVYFLSNRALQRQHQHAWRRAQAGRRHQGDEHRRDRDECVVLAKGPGARYRHVTDL